MKEYLILWSGGKDSFLSTCRLVTNGGKAIQKIPVRGLFGIQSGWMQGPGAGGPPRVEAGRFSDV